MKIKIRVCDVCGAGGKIRSGKNFGFDKLLCQKHYDNARRHGRLERNQIDVFDTHAEVHLSRRTGEAKVCLIDVEDVDKVSGYKWYCNASGYAYGEVNGKKMLMHRLLLGVHEDKGVIVDHESRDRLDNKKSNLRIVTKEENTRNHNKQRNNTSGITGVVWHKKSERWVARVNINKKQVELGRFASVEEATIVRLEAELKHYGANHAPQRHLFKQYGIEVDNNE